MSKGGWKKGGREERGRKEKGNEGGKKVKREWKGERRNKGGRR